MECANQIQMLREDWIVLVLFGVIMLALVFHSLHTMDERRKAEAALASVWDELSAHQQHRALAGYHKGVPDVLRIDHLHIHQNNGQGTTRGPA